MKKLVISIFVAVALCACRRDDDSVMVVGNDTNEWIYNVMKESYLWSDHMPSSYLTSGAGVSTKQYLENLRYRNDRTVPLMEDFYGDRFSRITKISTTTRADGVPMNYNSGFFPVAVGDKTTGEILYLQVCYVVPGSPADGKLKRGDAFRHINGTIATYDNIEELLSARTMEIDVFDVDNTSYNTVSIVCDGYYSQPIITDIIFEGRNTAYLAYTEFVMGGKEGASGSADALRQAFARYKSAGVRNLVLDLRYNGGGELTATQLLLSLIAPSHILGQVFMYMGDNTGDRWPVKLLQADYVPENADIEKLLVLTSKHSASASELLIHCLKPFYGNNIKIFGDTTMGKNVAGMTYVNERLGWVLSPIMGMVYNKDQQSGYEKGIAPDYFVEEFGNYPDSATPFFDMAPLGDYLNEHHLNVAMNWLFPDIPLTPFREAESSTRSGLSDPLIDVMVPEHGLSLGRREII